MKFVAFERSLQGTGASRESPVVRPVSSMAEMVSPTSSNLTTTRCGMP